MPRRPASKRPVVEVLRLGHRPGRDPRLTTHLALTARALGAQRLWLHPPDPDIAARIDAVRARWGGGFTVEPCRDWRRTISSFPGGTVHLTMYGEPIASVADALEAEPRLLAIVGGAKVPSELYQRARWNVSVGSQPHSEVAALALLLHTVLGPIPSRTWTGARQRIVPSPRGKRVVKVGE